MKTIKPYVTLETEINGDEVLKLIERAGRTCYKSEDQISKSSAEEFIKKILKSGHESVIEHYSITVRVVCDRGVTHEIVRHRIASYSQESTRYCNYTQHRFGEELTFIEPCYWIEGNDNFIEKKKIWENILQEIERQYFELIKLGASPQEARAILPNSLKTEIVITMNLREWRHFLKLRTAHAAHPQMREIANKILNIFKEKIPIVFDDIVCSD